MDFQTIVNFAIGGAIGVFGWFARTLWDAVSKLKDDLKDLEVKVGTDYVRYDRLQDALKPLMDGLNEIRDILHTKADKK